MNFTREEVRPGALALPYWARALGKPKRYKVLHGGRGSAKSETVARVLLRMGRKKRLKILCAREFQISITESVHALLKELIEQYAEFRDHYTVQRNVIIGKNGTIFIFAGIKTNIKKIKSMQGVDIVWVEEADVVSKESWDILIPTIRKNGSEIWVTFNPDLETDPTSQLFLVNPDLERMLVLQVNWRDNPWFPEELEKERAWAMKVDPDAAMHVWEGKFRSKSKASIFGDKYRVEPVIPQKGWYGPYYGADWGFSTDPDTVVEVWIGDNKIWVRREAYEVGVELNSIHKLWAKAEVPIGHIEPHGVIQGHVIRADNSRPETINHMRGYGYNVIPAQKWSGSVEDGIKWLRQFEAIVFDPSCKHGIFEAQEYKYKVDKLTGDILTDIVDRHNHIWDAVRYALEPLIKVADHQAVVVYDGESQAIDPDLDEFELRQELEAW